ncbi:D-alanine--poly(phosphoribitol) ligase subunit DltA [Streptomyces vinaceus]|uniref:D-alanine--poly(phosphoribitol) ligase subunit DltA n=1 Tax=Streptomyces vinaceus TaxID=1960 RepID=UPI0036B5E095
MAVDQDKVQGGAPQEGPLTFLREVAGRGVRFFLEDGRLRSTGAEELTPQESAFVRENKAEIIAHLLPRTQAVPAADTAQGAAPADPAPVPPSHQQERLWLLHEIAERSEAYNSVTVLEVRGAFDPGRFADALRGVVADNDALRTVFRTRGDTVHQELMDTPPWIGIVHADTSEEALLQARALEQVELDHQFDLRNEVPVRCRIVTGPEDLHHIVLNIHHIACDGWSISLILDRLAQYYENPEPGPDSAARAHRDYRDYARWQRTTLTGDVLDSLVDQWERRLDGAPRRHALPADFTPDPAAHRGADVVRSRLDGETYAAFRKVCLADDATEFAGLHALLGVLLARVSGQEETVVGSPIANREQRDIHGTIGFFVNMIAIRGAVPSEATFREVLAVKKDEIEFGYTFQQAPFERVVERLVEGREGDTTPVFQIVLVLQNNRVTRPVFGTAVTRELPEAHRHSRFDLEIFVHGEGESREIEWVYHDGLFERATIERWADWFTVLLAEAAEHPDRPVADLTGLAPSAPASTGDRTAPYAPAPEPSDSDAPAQPGAAACTSGPVALDVMRRIAAVAAAEPDRIAVSDGRRQDTYAELLDEGRRIGAALLARHGRDAVFALSMERSLELVRTVVGILSIGAAYVFVDRDDAAVRRAAVLESSRPGCLLVSEELPELAAQAAAHGVEVIDVRTLRCPDGPLPEQPEVPADPERDVYHVFTSGSTGRPKGVRVTYGNLSAYLGGVVTRLGLRARAGHAWHSSPATDFGNTVLFGALASGGRLEIATRDDILDGTAMRAFLRDRAVDVLKITPSHLEALLQTHPISELLPRTTLVLGGEAASPGLIRTLRTVPSDVRVFNHYGPSETTVGVFVADFADRDERRVFAIGRPLPGTEFTVEDERGRPVPFGAAGELVVRGPQVAAGYLGRALDDGGPFFMDGATRGYRTGDQVRQRNDGQVVFLGRRDGQVKIRGHRVELGEIKAALEAAPGVARGEVLVTGGPDEPRSLVAFVQRALDSETSEEPAGPADPAAGTATVDQWREFYDYAYSERVTGDIEFNTSGWISSYTGERIPEPQMRAWLDSTLRRISSLAPVNVLEIGCGLGIIAYPLSRSVRSYLACDFSSSIIEANRANARLIDTGDLTFFTCEADEIDRYADRVRAAGVDTVIINSVVQYFPDAAYLESVLDKVLAIDTVRHVFVGDVRNTDLLEEFGLSLVDARDAALPEPRPAIERLRLARNHAEGTGELLLSDLYWDEFARTRRAVAGVSVLPRVSTYSSELLDFRYDVVLTKDARTLAHPAAGPDVAAGGPADLDRLRRELAAGAADMAVVRGVRNDRTAAHCENLHAIASGVGAAAARPAAQDRGRSDLAEVLAAAAADGLHASPHYARDEHGRLSRLDIALFRDGGSGLADSRLLGTARDTSARVRPLVHAPSADPHGTAWTDAVAAALTVALPRHMSPDRIVEVPAFPLNKTGKIDQRALLALVPRRTDGAAFGELADDTERRLAELLRGLLDPGTPIDRESDFFAIGGHSLLATRYVHAVNQAFGVDLRVKAVFDRPVVREFAALVGELAGTGTGTAPAVAALPPAGSDRHVESPVSLDAVPISPLQQRFWTMAQATGPSTLYNSLTLLELSGTLSAETLATAFADVVGHHRTLRARFDRADGSIVLRIREAEDYALARLDLPGLDLAGAERILNTRLSRPFDLETGPLLDAAVITAADDRHYLAMAIHHAIFDGTSEELFIADLRTAYEARLAGRAPRWDTDGIGFLRHLSSTRPPGAESTAFWVRHLSGAPALHALPLDGERPESLTAHEGAALHTVLSAETTALVTELARRHRTTTFVVLNTLVALFVSFLSGEDDIVIGSPVDCRQTQDDGSAVGMYVNTVALRHRLDWNSPVEAAIVRAKEFFRDAVDHMTVPFDQLVQELNPQRLAGANPVFQIMLALQPEGSETFPFHTAHGRSVKAAVVESKFDLTLNAKIVDGCLHVHWEYARTLFSAERMARTAALFEPFLATATAHPQLPPAAHRFAETAGAAGQNTGAALLTGPVVPLTDTTWLDAHSRVVAAHGDRTAIRTPQGDTWDHRTFDARADALAALLHERGVRPHDLVALTLARSAESLVAVLAVNKLGAAYVPMDSEYLRGSAPDLLDAYGIRFALVEDGDGDRFPLRTVTRSEFPAPGPVAPPAHRPAGTDLCYVIFTSGSTGRPKGVAVTHRAVTNYLAHCAGTYLEHGPEEAVVVGPLSFDATVTTTLFALSAGLTLRIVPEGDELPGLLRELGADAGVPRLFKLTPSHLVALANLGATQQVRPDRHTFVIGGEDLKAGVAAPWYRAYPNGSLFNEYGPTEAAVGCVVHRVNDRDLAQGSVRIGRPICNTTIAVVTRGNLCLPDQRGEIVILGESLARGYLDDEQTASAFRPVAALGGATGYHSGDLASLTGSDLRYHGRATREIKIRGFRVSLPAIEAAIGEADGVTDCVCAVSPDGRSLRAYVVTDGSLARTTSTAVALRDSLRRRLPSHMVPDALYLLAELPLTPNGKADLDRLHRDAATRAPVTAGGGTASGTAPGTAGSASVARRLEAVWQGVLETSEPLPADVSFFSLGGNSLSTTVLLRRVNEEFGTRLTLEALYRESTLVEQAALLDAALPDRAGETPADPDGAQAPYDFDLTPAQSRLYLLEKLGTGADYVNPICFRLAPGIDLALLHRALKATLDRHPLLTSRVVEEGERLVLRPGSGSADGYIGDPHPCPDEATALRCLGDARGEAVNIFGGPLFRAVCHPLPDGSAVLQMVVHHVVFDGWSERILLEDLAARYSELVRGEAPDGLPSPFHFGHHAAALALQDTGQDTTWWIEQLTGAPAAHNLPTREGGRADRENPAETFHRVFGQADTETLAEACRSWGVTPFHVIHTVLALAVCNMSHEDDVVIGVPTANRGDSRHHDTVGLFMETLPLRTRVGGAESTFTELLHSNRATVTSALGRTGFRIEDVLSACAPHRDGSRNPLYQIMLSFNDEGGETLRLGDVRAERFLLPSGPAKLDLIVDAKMIDGALHLFWEYDPGLLAHSTVLALADHVEEWLSWALAGPDRPLGTFTTRAGRILADAAPDRAPVRRSAYERFVTAWEGRADELAYTERDIRLTAGELHERIDALAALLGARGIGRKSVVACLSGQVLDHVVTLLACSRTGAVHVPLDTSNPPERIREILETVDADAVVAESPDAVPAPFPSLTTKDDATGLPVPPPCPGGPAGPSHIMFTSGSTGRPKGVRLDNTSLDAYVDGINAAYGGPDSVIAQCGNPAYDVFVEELGLSLLVGNRLAVLPPEERADPAAFAAFVARERITHLPLPTSYWAFLTAAMSDEDFDRLRDVRVCAVGGEDYPAGAAQTWFRHFPDGPRLFNVYGPTENGPVSLVCELRPDTPPSTLGTPLREVVCEVRSRFGATVPVEGRGELVVHGPQLFDGYVGAASVAAYPTGDIVLRDGVHGLRFVERAVTMMKISGFRVEPGEYTALLAGIPGIEDLRVTANPERTGVILYALLQEGAAHETELARTVAQHINGSLPGYMRGHQLRFCRQIPLTPNGKADFRALAELSWAAPEPEPAPASDTDAVGPRAEIRDLWRTVLPGTPLDEHRGFFDHGGTSLTMLRLLTLLDGHYPGCFELIDLYEKPSIDLQARHVHERTRTDRETAPAAPSARERLARKRRARRETGSGK